MALLVPTFPPFTFHWYVGELIPFAGVAVNVTLVPVQIAPCGFAVIVTPAIMAFDEFTVAQLGDAGEPA